jgi:hypothetical protein
LHTALAREQHGRVFRWLVLGCFVLFSWRCAAHAQTAPAAGDGEAIEPTLHAAVRAYDTSTRRMPRSRAK